MPVFFNQIVHCNLKPTIMQIHMTIIAKRQQVPKCVNPDPALRYDVVGNKVFTACFPTLKHTHSVTVKAFLGNAPEELFLPAQARVVLCSLLFSF